MQWIASGKNLQAVKPKGGHGLLEEANEVDAQLEPAKDFLLILYTLSMLIAIVNK